MWVLQDPPALGEATLADPSSPVGQAYASSCPGCLGHPQPWTRLGCGRKEGGPWDGVPAPQLEGNIASLGSWSQKDSWLSARFELTVPADSNQMFLLFPNQRGEWG